MFLIFPSFRGRPRRATSTLQIEKLIQISIFDFGPLVNKRATNTLQHLENYLDLRF